MDFYLCTSIPGMDMFGIATLPVSRVAHFHFIVLRPFTSIFNASGKVEWQRWSHQGKRESHSILYGWILKVESCSHQNCC